MRWAAWVLASMAVMFVASSARAAKLGLVVEDPRDPFVAKLVAELAQLGFEAATSSEDDMATLRVSRTELHLDAAGRRTTFERTDALKVAERVHAVLLPLVERPSSAPAVEAAPPEPHEAPAPRIAPSPEVTRPIELSGGGGAFFGGIDPGASLRFSAAWMPTSMHEGRFAFGVSLGTLMGLVPEGVSDMRGSASLRAFLFGPEVVGQLALGGGTFVELGVGVWAHHVRISGEANAPYPSRSDAAWSWGPVAHARLRYDLGEAVGLYVEPMGGLSIPGIAVRFASSEVATWGRPWANVGGGIRAAF